MTKQVFAYNLSAAQLGSLYSQLTPDSARSFNLRYGVAGPQYQMQVFKDSGMSSPADGVFINFSGGDGTTVMSTNSSSTNYVDKNYVVANWTAVGAYPYFLGTNDFDSQPNHMHLYWAHEVEAALQFLFGVVAADPAFSSILTPTTPIYMTGHSRGAVVIAYWAQFADSWSSFASRVKAVGANSPCGAITGFGGREPFLSMRTVYACAQKSTVPMLLTVGADDQTHSSRAMMERINLSLDTPERVKIKVIGGVGNGHAPFGAFGSDYTKWMDLVVAHGAAAA